MSTNALQSLNPLTLPLNHNALIEASAGTGKTYTITTLYLRALLGLVDGKYESEDDESTELNANRKLQPLTVDKILVVTFTEAATQEIRERVRAKLIEAQQHLIHSIAAEESGNNKAIYKLDPILEKLFSHYRSEYIKQYLLTLSQAQQSNIERGQVSDEYHHTEPSYLNRKANLAAYHLIQDALVLSDDAAIFTIHGFCNRCLQQFAFETNSRFQQRFEMDNREYQHQALLDFWRSQVSLLKGAEFDWFRHYWRNPESLNAELTPVINQHIYFKPEIDLTKYQSLLKEYQTLVTEIKALWQSASIYSKLKDSGLKANLALIKRLDKLNSFMLADTWLGSDIGDKHRWDMWGASSITNVENYKQGSKVIEPHRIFDLFDELQQITELIQSGAIKSYWLQQAKKEIQARSEQIKQQQQVITPDDLLIQLHEAVTKAPDSLVSNSTSDTHDALSTKIQLLNAIRRKYPLAFVDEFQDTDPIQYAIFKAIFNSGYRPVSIESECLNTKNQDSQQPQSASQDNKHTKASMILIGDPKQAIYKFRGADIYTYIEAKEDLDDSHKYTLDTNWRSHPNIVSSVNTLFA